MSVGSESVTLGVWDTAGAERYESMSRIYYRAAKAALICFDLTDAESFEKVKLWVKELTESEPQCQLYVVGTKLDMLANGAERGVDALAARNFATQHGARYHETSSLTGRGIPELFDDVASRYLETLNAASSAQQQQQQQQSVQKRAAASGNVRLDGKAAAAQRNARRKKQSEKGCCE